MSITPMAMQIFSRIGENQILEKGATREIFLNMDDDNISVDYILDLILQ